MLWQPPDRPRLRVAPDYAAAIRLDADEVRDILRRAACFRRQIEEHRGRPSLPPLILPEAPAPRLGRCVSCGARRPTGWRCRPCLVAVFIALELNERLTEIVKA